uniref:Uncharacterized protein n=1 Tax=Physcomitrium patens TaxID=3218 RepID=A0A2K1JBD3_PHYPA|nr:hypothetical protein PHYPA_019117 [Physcomitrium patens]
MTHVKQLNSIHHAEKIMKAFTLSSEVALRLVGIICGSLAACAYGHQLGLGQGGYILQLVETRARSRQGSGRIVFE